MELIIDLDSPTPLYEQLRSQVTDLVEAGVLPPGYTLPSVRVLAAELGVAPGTIARAYRELGEAGLVRSSRAAGTRVADAPRLDASTRDARLAEAAQRLAGTARRLGADDDAVGRALRRALTEE